jgi:hypothetical protein
LINEHVEERNLDHFPSWKSVFERSGGKRFAQPNEEFSEIIQPLQNEFPSRFYDFHSRFSEILLLQNPFKIDINDVDKLQMEAIELQTNNSL